MGQRRLASAAMLTGLVASVLLVRSTTASAASPAPGARPDVPVDPELYTVPYRVHRYPAAAVDPTDPRHIVEIDTDQAAVHCTSHASFDGGYTWSSSPVPLPIGWSVCKQQGNNTRSRPGQPSIAFGPDGTVYAVVLPTNSPSGNSDTGAFAVETSRDGGRTFSPLSFAFPTSSGPNPTNHAYVSYLAVDTTDGPYRGSVYVVGSDVAGLGAGTSPPGPQISISRDGGHTFSSGQPVGLTPANSASRCCAEVGLGPQGEVDVVAPFVPATGTARDCLPSPGQLSLTGSCSSVVLYRSQDGGATWSPPVPLYNQAVSASDFSSSPGGSAFAMGVDPASGTVYAVIADPHPGNDGIWIASLPRGSAVATAVEVAHAPAGSDVGFPAASATAGRLDFAYFLIHRGSAKIVQYDTSGKPSGTYDASQEPCATYAGGYGHYPGFGDTCPTNVFYGYTTDGTSFPLARGQQINSVTFDNLVGWEYGGDGNQVALNGLALISTPTYARAFWTDSRNNTDQSDGNQDQYSRCLPFDPAACPVPPGFHLGAPLLGIPGFVPASSGGVLSQQLLGRSVLRRDVYEPKPTFPPPLPGAPPVASPPIIRTVLAADQYVPLYIASIVAAVLALLVILGTALWRAYRWLVA